MPRARAAYRARSASNRVSRGTGRCSGLPFMVCPLPSEGLAGTRDSMTAPEYGVPSPGCFPFSRVRSVIEPWKETFHTRPAAGRDPSTVRAVAPRPISPGGAVTEATFRGERAGLVRAPHGAADHPLSHA